MPSQTVALRAPAGAPAVELFHDQGIIFTPIITFDFGPVALGSQATANFSPWNQGSVTAVLEQDSATGDFSTSTLSPRLSTPGGPPSAPVFIPHFSMPVTFRPTAAGARSGQFVLVESAGSATHVVQLTGTGVTDFSLSVDPNSNQVSVRGGGSATASLVLSAAPGFTGSGSFSCNGLPAGANCAASPGSFSFSGAGGTQSIILTLSTTGPLASLQNHPGGWWWAGLSVFGLALAGRKPRRRVRSLAMLGLLTVTMLMVSCGGGSNGSSQGPPGNTPPGTFNITVSASSGGTSRSAVVILVVR